MQPGDVEQTFADIGKAKHLLDWEPKIRLDIGLLKFTRWFKENRI